MAAQKLYSQTQNNLLISDNVQIAKSFISRGKGLIGKSHMPAKSALWIKPCSHVHTCFMRFSIDLIFVDKNLVVKKIFTNARPWRHVFLGSWKADSVFEMPENSLKDLNIHIGDKLYVGT